MSHVVEKTASGVALVTHQFPIRLDLTVPITLSVLLSRTDAERLARFAMGLAFDDGDETTDTGETNGGA